MKINLINKKIAILGYGREGVSTLKFLQKNKIPDGNITIIDKDLNLKIDNFNGKIITGKDYLKDLDKYDYIFKSPGISPYVNNLIKYKDKIISQGSIFFDNYNGKIISITQTKGKSTTSALIYELLKNAGYKVKLVGNIGTPVLDEIDLEKDNYDFVVYELSSYMLQDLENHHSYISIFGNIFIDHLDWHLNFENYFNAKKKILKNASNILIGKELFENYFINSDLKNKNNCFTFGPKNSDYSYIGNDFFIKDKFIGTIKPILKGEHNLKNICACFAVSSIIGINFDIFKNTIEKFSGLPHRMENIGNFNGIIFIDDAISTTPESTIEAIKTFKDNLETIFLGGTDRGYNFDKLSFEIEKSNIKNIVLFPESGKNIKKTLNIKKYNILETNSMKKAVEFAFKNTKAGNICLLSTASPSYSLWKNFEEKGNEFKKEVIRFKF